MRSQVRFLLAPLRRPVGPPFAVFMDTTALRNGCSPHSTSLLFQRQNRGMRFARRIISALVMTIAAAGAIRVKGRGGTPPRHGGWRPVRIPPTESETE